MTTTFCKIDITLRGLMDSPRKKAIPLQDARTRPTSALLGAQSYGGPPNGSPASMPIPVVMIWIAKPLANNAPEAAPFCATAAVVVWQMHARLWLALRQGSSHCHLWIEASISLFAGGAGTRAGVAFWHRDLAGSLAGAQPYYRLKGSDLTFLRA